jgi:cytochrome b561
MPGAKGLSAQALTPTDRYGAAAVGFHWAMAVLIVVVGVLGLLHDSWPKQSAPFWINLHAMIGLLAWALLIARFWWRHLHPPPPSAPEAGEFSRRFAGPVHALLYTLIFVIPILGVVTFVWHGRVFDFGLFRLNFGIRSNRAIFHPTEDIHGYLAYALFALAGGHALAALWHHVIRRDGTLSRMWPSRRPRE